MDIAIRIRKARMTPLEETEVLGMDWTMTLTFGGLSVIAGVLVGLGTLSPIRGVFTFLVFLGISITMLLSELGVSEIQSFFLGQLIVMGSSYLCLSILRPELLAKIGEEFARDKVPSCH